MHEVNLTAPQEMPALVDVGRPKQYIPAHSGNPRRWIDAAAAPSASPILPPVRQLDPAIDANRFAPSVASRLISSSMTFAEASARFLDSKNAPNWAGRAQYIAPRTYKDLVKIVGRLGLYFAPVPLGEIRVEHMGEYQRRRSLGEGFTRKFGREVVTSLAGPGKINAELSVLIRILRLAGCWSELMAVNYQRLQVVDKEFEPALTPEEQETLLARAASSAAWHPLYWYALIALHTTFSSDEMRTIRLGDINLTHQVLGVNRRYGKNRVRRREIVLTDPDCLWALQQLIGRASRLTGSIQGPSAHLFPLRLRRNCYDAQQPMTEAGMRRAFEQLRVAAGVPWFRFNGFRHTAITRLAEAGVPIAIIQRRAGHISPVMTAHYTHICEQQERLAMEQVSARRSVLGPSAAELRRKMAGY